MRRVYEFGPFLLDPAERLLSRDGEVVLLQPKVFDLLLALVERHGRLVEKEELMTAVWPDTFVEEANIASNISILRKTLSQNGQQFIETVPKRGYRFVAEVREVGSNSLDSTAHSPIAVEAKGEGDEEASARQKWARWWKAVIAAGAALLCVAGWVYFGLGRKAEKAAPASIKSIAVLPFKPLNSSQDDEYLGIGLADAVITKLSGAGKIIVRSTGSVSKYAASGQDPLAAGREQQVDAVLDASLWRSGEKIRVTARLLSVQDGRLLWSYQCEELCTDVFAVQTLISEQVAGALMPQLTGAERARLTKHYTEDREANRLYLKGRYLSDKRTRGSLWKAVEFFQQAVALDPNYARAYAGLADSYVMLGIHHESQREVFPKAKEAAAKALAMDESIAEAHASLAYINLWGDWEWANSEKEFKQALQLDPNYANAHLWYAVYLMAMGKIDESLAEGRRAVDLDPASVAFNTFYGWLLFYAHRPDQAIEQCRKALELDPNFAQAHGVMANAYWLKGLYEESVNEKIQNRRLLGAGPEEIAALKQAYV